MTPLLELRDVSVGFGDVWALRDVALTFDAGTVVGLIGPNGAGKTTLLDAVSGFVPTRTGTVVLDGRRLDGVAAHRRARLGIGRTFQSVGLFDDMSVAANLAVSADSAPHRRADPRRAAELVGIDPSDPRLAGALSVGERKRVAMARALTATPKLLLLDEPAAGLDHDERTRLGAVVREVAKSGCCVVLVDHDLSLVLDTCDRVVVLDLGRVIADAAPAAVRRDPAVLEAYVGTAPVTAPTAAPTTSDGSPRLALSARGLTAGYHGLPVVHDIDLDVAQGEIVALLGPNGAGKTTTLLTMSGALARMSGEVVVLGRPQRATGGRLAVPGVAHVLQRRGVFTELTAAENLRLVDASGAATTDVLELLPALAPLLRTPAGRLSGGQQQLLALARALVARPALLLIDELSLGLAPKVVGELLDILTGLSRESGTAVLMAEQHAPLALGVAHRAYVLAAGRIVDSGPGPAFLADPDRLAAGYLGRG